MGHLSGAFHPGPSGAGSVMRYGPAGAFDQQNARIIRMMRARDFTTGVRGVDEAMRKAWSTIYAEGHASDEPNPLAGAIANAGAALAAEGKMPEAEALIREAVGVDPSAARVHSMLGLLLSEQGRPAEPGAGGDQRAPHRDRGRPDVRAGAARAGRSARPRRPAGRGVGRRGAGARPGRGGAERALAAPGRQGAHRAAAASDVRGSAGAGDRPGPAR